MNPAPPVTMQSIRTGQLRRLARRARSPEGWRARTAKAVRARPKDDPGRAGGRPKTREKGGDARGPV